MLSFFLSYVMCIFNLSKFYSTYSQIGDSFNCHLLNRQKNQVPLSILEMKLFVSILIRKMRIISICVLFLFLPFFKILNRKNILICYFLYFLMKKKKNLFQLFVFFLHYFLKFIVGGTSAEFSWFSRNNVAFGMRISEIQIYIFNSRRKIIT